jgi:nicotinamidase/pyrazinamidase
MNALLLIDLQVDFAPGGALPVPEGDQVVAIANTLMRKFDVVVATQDWHPANHGSFAANNPGRKPGELITLDGLDQILWPIHCVQESKGAEFLQGLNVQAINHISRKGLNPVVDSYSGFFDNSTGLLVF